MDAYLESVSRGFGGDSAVSHTDSGHLAHTVTVDVRDCARCTEDHQGVVFKMFTMYSIDDSDGEDWTHWGMCPLMEEPILLRVVQE